MQQCGIILLAAGTASRMGRAKQLLPYKGKTFLAHSLDAALQSQAEPVILVTGANAPEIENEVRESRVNVVENATWEEGIASSIRCGLNALLEIEADVENAIFMVCDQPFVTEALLNQLIFAAIDTEKEIIACAYSGTLGTPALFGKAFFPLLSQLEGDEGAKKIMKQYPDAVGTVDFPEGSIDVDTKEDYEKLKTL
jgi:molybdenum cofactor cytidylyltransferase